MTGRWTTPADVRARVRRRWDDGSLLGAYAAGKPFPVVEVPLRGPRVAEIGDDLGAVQQWVSDLEAGRRRDGHYALQYAPVGGRLIGRNQLPSRAVVSAYSQAWAILGVRDEVQRYDELLGQSESEPVVRRWVANHPHKALDLHAAWPAMLAAYRWLEDHRGSDRYLRQISAPGVDTKVVERHRGVLASLLGVSSSSAGFVAGLGLAAKPLTVRLRFDQGFAGLPCSLSEGTFRLAELARVRVAVQQAVLVENEVTFLSLPVPHEGVVLWGKGFQVDRAGSLPWLRGAEVSYWGDLDTHGFAILDRLRAWLPQTRSFLMDRETLLEHRERWGRDGSPTHARLARLSLEEAALYEDLVSDRLGDRVRLEQERIDWRWAEERVPYAAWRPR